MRKKQQRQIPGHTYRLPAFLSFRDAFAHAESKRSSKNRLAESKSIPCFRKLTRFLTSSHSKRNRQYHFVCTDGGRQESQGF